jgi:hypothetical protein
MPNKCLKCGDEFPFIVMINGKNRNLGSRKYCLRCSPFKSHNTLKIHISGSRNDKCQCESCKRKYCYSKSKGHTRKICNSCIVKKSRLKFKKKMVEYKGGKCEKCGYNKSVYAMDFHHLYGKDFRLSRGYHKSWKLVKAELDKCSLLCSNCHREIHFGLS